MTAKKLKSIFSIDWILFFATWPLLGAGLITMNTFGGENYFFEKQVVWIGVSFVFFFALSFIDFRLLKKTQVLITLFGLAVITLSVLLVLNNAVQGARSWFDLGIFSFQPSDPIKILLILILAKYFSRRHIEIAHIRHIFVSGFYALVLFVLVFLQPDFGSAIILFFIWLGMVMVSGISKKHLFTVFLIGLASFGLMWGFVFQDYQKDRIRTFINPLADIQGTGYNAYQSTIAVGSGKVLGKGVGYGTQSRLRFLPEYETDFIFAAFAEEWGFVGVSIVFLFYAIVIWRILHHAMRGSSNFETLYALGLAILFISHFIVHVGMNIGLLPVTGTTVPFMSYGGSHLITEYIGLGILVGMSRYKRTVHRDEAQREFLEI